MANQKFQSKFKHFSTLLPQVNHVPTEVLAFASVLNRSLLQKLSKGSPVLCMPDRGSSPCFGSISSVYIVSLDLSIV